MTDREKIDVVIRFGIAETGITHLNFRSLSERTAKRIKKQYLAATHELLALVLGRDPTEEEINQVTER